MRLIDYGKYGYKCLELDGTVLFKEDGTHSSLFEYIYKDLSIVSDLFMEYIKCKLDIETLDIIDGLPDDKILKQLDKTLKAVHPYFQYAYKNAGIDVIGTYFNDLLLYRCYGQRTLRPETASSEKWYHERLTTLLKPFLEEGKEYPMFFYNSYKQSIGDNIYYGDKDPKEYESFVLGGTSSEPCAFSSEILTQKVIRNALYFTLDIMAQDLNSLTTSQRVWLFKNIHYSQFDTVNMSVKGHLLFSEDSPIFIGDYNDIFSKLASLEGKNIENGKISQEEKEALRAAVNLAKKQKNIQKYQAYEVTSLEQLLSIEIMAMIQNETMIRRCRNCGKYFVITNRNTAYCDRIDESGKRCSAVGPSRSFRKKMEEDEALKIYTRAYKTHFARVKKGTMGKAAFTEWCKEAKGKLEHVRSGLLDMAAFQEWLKR